MGKLKEDAHQFLINKGVRSLADQCTAFQIEQLLIEFAEHQMKSLKKELEITDKLLKERQKVLDAIPECKSHGSCVPHAIEWIEEMKSKQQKRIFSFDYIGKVSLMDNKYLVGENKTEEIEAYDAEHATLLFKNMHPNKPFDPPY